MRVAALSAISLSPSVAWRFAALFSSSSESSSPLIAPRRHCSPIADFESQYRKAISGLRWEPSALLSVRDASISAQNRA